MKYKIYSLIIGTILLFSSACNDTMDEKHENPDGFTTTEIEYLFAQGTIYAVEIDYGDFWNHVFRWMGTQTQTLARRTGSDRINLYTIQNDKGRWENYYVKRMSPLIEADLIYKNLSDAEKEQYRIYIEAGKVLKAFNTALATDFFGNMPYKEAFTARNTIYGGEVIFNPKYDTQQEIYYAILDDLKTASEYFKTAQSNTTFDRQDVLYNGNTNGWYKFANSLRLRYAMRISYADEAKAREVLSSLNKESLITSNSDNACIKVQSQSYAPDAIWRAMNESHNSTHGYYAHAPEGMVNLLKGAADPRLQVLFQPASNDDGVVYDEAQEIIGYPSSADEAIALTSGDQSSQLGQIYGVVNSTTFRKNYYFPSGIGMTAAETYLYLAEAAARGLISDNAEELYYKGIITSTQNYYDYYVNSTAETKVAAIAQTDVTDATLAAWVANSPYKYNASKAIEQIATQMWVHLGFIQPFQTWSELRRTDYPVLDDDREKGTLLNKANAPVRLMYAATEASMNTDNYNAQSQYNDPKVRLWWDVK